MAFYFAVYFYTRISGRLVTSGRNTRVKLHERTSHTRVKRRSEFEIQETLTLSQEGYATFHWEKVQPLGKSLTISSTISQIILNPRQDINNLININYLMAF